MPHAIPLRLNRTELAVPASRPELFSKAARSAADVVFLDLEDAVAPGDKTQARTRNGCIAIWSISSKKRATASIS
jgi:citrate lyase beta subunit